MVVVATTLGGCAASTRYDPYQVERAHVREQVRTIAIAPHPVPYELMDADVAREIFEPIAIRRLEAAGFEVVPSSVWSEIWRTAAEDVGGVFDPRTLETNDEKLELVLDTTLHRLQTDYGVDARLFFEVGVVELQRQSVSPVFCGKGTRLAFGRATSPQPVGRVTSIRASCLHASLIDMEDRLLYSIRHGIEVFEIHARQTRYSMPRQERLTDMNAIEEAASAVLDPLVQNATAGR